MEKVASKEEFPCRKKCGKVFDRKTNRDRHESKKNPCKGTEQIPEDVVVQKPVISCRKNWCNRTFLTTFNRNRHEDNCHNKTDQRKCFICKKVFTRGTHLRRHMAVHAGGKKKKKASGRSSKQKKKAAKQPTEVESDDIEGADEFPSMAIEGDDEFPSMAMPSTSNHNLAGEDCLALPPCLALPSTPCVALPSSNHHSVSSSPLSPSYNNNFEPLPSLSETIHSETIQVVPGEVYVLDDDVNFYIGSPEYAKDNDELSESSNSMEIDSALKEDLEQSDEEEIWTKDLVAEELSCHMTVAEATLKYIKNAIHMSKRSIKKRIATATYLKDIFDNNLKSEAFLVYLARQLSFDSSTHLQDYLAWSEKDYSFVQGRRDHKVSEEVVQKVVDFWKSKSTLSVDRRNNRHHVRINPKKCHSIYNRIVTQGLDDQVTLLTDEGEKHSGKYQAHRHIYTKSVRKLHKAFLKEHPLHYVSRGLFHTLKPFYIGPATANEMLSCVCIKCQNAHGLYAPIQKSSDEFPDSLTEFLTETICCEKDENLNFNTLQCIRGTCARSCSLSTSTERTFDDNTPKRYYTAEKVPTVYYNKQGKKCEYMRVARVNKSATLQELYTKLEDIAVEYLLHRHSVVADRVFWAHMSETLEQPYIHMDYSQNIALKPKHEVQSQHYSGKEQTLHCTVLVFPDGNRYLYHLSDDTNHDSVMTFEVLESIIQEHPELIEGGVLIIKSDNCSTQYKSRHTFMKMSKLAAKYQCNVFWFYGEAGHGRGLVDAMSSFGCKKILRDAIVSEDVWFHNASEMTDFLKCNNSGPTTKEYYFIDEAETAKLRRKKKQDLKRAGCMSFCMMAVNSQGQWMVRDNLDINDEKLVNMKFDEPEEMYDINTIEYHDIFDEEDVVASMAPIPDEVCLPIIYEMIEPGTFVGIRSGEVTMEEFYVAEVVFKKVADDYVSDNHGHRIGKGQPYVCVNYLEKSVKSTNRTVKYSRSKLTSVFIDIGDNVIFEPNVQLSEHLTMPMTEYQSLLVQVFG